MFTHSILKKLSLVVFVIALISIHDVKSLSTKSMDCPALKLNDVKKLTFEQLYAHTVEQVDKIYQESNWNTEDLTFEEFSIGFVKGNFCKIAEDACTTDRIADYFVYFLNNKGKLTKKGFTRFYAGFWTEGQLLIDESHPLLSVAFRNKCPATKDEKINPIAKEYFKIILRYTDKTWIHYKLHQNSRICSDKLFKILENSKLWNRLSKNGAKPCKLKTIVHKNLRLFSPHKRCLNKNEYKVFLLYWTFLDIQDFITRNQPKPQPKVVAAPEVKPKKSKGV